ncbi:hypothetical protein K443DRAFT_5934 [Laccaria amethystina LaAM-08-1]|uniref:Carboxylesterase type B domain-containing protein n=1 Tax=Laccaria amethystina LaAM-08-1 TaxID=1095629 RepID=A0A0C9XY80_9AGAR|nr:hypothetical protein K443DRAFT_5934 [Laccaria amethystina LaAM-08-1]
MTGLTRILPYILFSISSSPQGPFVALHYGSFQGNLTGDSVEFLGILFAAPPVGKLPFAPPETPIPFKGRRGLSFPRYNLPVPSPTAVSEDCLFIKPANIPEGKKLPVVVWIYGGSFLISEPHCNLNIFQGLFSQEIVLHTRVDQLAALAKAYPEDPTQGAPFDTGTANALTFVLFHAR